jgi:outer membrane autotransporter protein
VLCAWGFIVSRFAWVSRWFGVLAAALVCAALSATAASAQASFSVSFSPSSISVGGTATLTYTITGDAIFNADNVNFSNTLPSGLVVATPSGLSIPDNGPGSCNSGTATAADGSGSVSFGVSTVGSNRTCIVKVNVTATSPGTKTNTVTLSFLGGSDTKTATLTVTPAASTTTLTSSLNPSQVGQPVTFTATVTGTSPTGTVTFKDGATVLGTVALSGGVAALTTSSLATGSHSITAEHSGDANNGPSTSAPLMQTVSVAGTATALTSSLNPSQAGQAVAFTATVTGVSPTGTVTFKDGATVLGTVALSGGVATLSTSALTTGAHSITAEYGGDANNGPSASAALIQTVNTPADSLKLRSMQVLGTKIAAQTSGQAISGAIGSAIGQGFSGNGFQMGVNGTPFSIAAAATPPGDGRMTLGAGLNAAREAPPSGSAWTPWVDVRGTGWDTDAKDADIDGTQLNVLAGVTWRPASDFIVGALAGYESFNYSSDLLTGQLDGNGWTVGGYLGWRLAPGLLLDVGGTRSDIDYDASAGTAAGSFTGERWLVSGGLTGTYRSSAFIFEPSARVFALWESEDAYVDNLGTVQDARDFSTGRASAGLKVGYPVAWSSTVTVVPYAGAFADYYFSSDNAAALTIPALLPEEFVDGAAARIVSGLVVTAKDGARLALDGELGGLGNDFETWTARGSFATPF